MKRHGPLFTVFSSALLASACPQSGDQSAPETSSSATSSTSADPSMSTPTTGATSATTSSTSTSSSSGPLDTGGSSSTTDESGSSHESSSGSTTGEPLQNCGDGELDLDLDEECDLGVDNDDNGDCTVECKKATCGDKLTWEGHEDCDNGPNNNDNLYGGCTTQCQFGARCNDGIVQDMEECDLGEGNGSGEFPAEGVPCDDGCRFIARLAFLSSEIYQGGVLDGVEGADIKCQTLAETAKFDNANMFKAWLSDSQHSPEQDFTKDVDLPIVRPDGIRIANNWDDLVLNGPVEGIIVTEKGEALLDESVWTGTTPSGKLFDAAMTCQTWSSSSLLEKGWAGLSGVDKQETMKWEKWVAERHWTNRSLLTCNWELRLYCIEQ